MIFEKQILSIYQQKLLRRRDPDGRAYHFKKSDFPGLLSKDYTFRGDKGPKGYFRLSPGKEVRLRYGYFIRCEEVVKDAAGNVVELKCTFDPATRGGNAPDGRKVKGTIHWVAAESAVEAEIRLYDRLFTEEQPGVGGVDFLTQLNPDSLKTVTGYLEPELAKVESGASVQFERLGYFVADPDSKPGKMVFNRTVTLKDSWGNKQNKK